MPFNPDFDTDFSRGRLGEELLESLPEMIKNKTVEVKTDYRSSETGNFYVETWHRNIYTMEWRQSGINVTKADYWAFIVPSTMSMYLIRTENLKNLLRTNDYREGTQYIASATTNASKGRLVPVKDIANQMLGKIDG